MSILVLNAGSSTLKFSLFDEAARKERATGTLSWAGKGERAHLTANLGGEAVDRPTNLTERGMAVAEILGALQRLPDAPPVRACGHRIVHGGAFRGSVKITGEVVRAIEELSELAPLHNPPALAGIAAAQNVLPNVPHVAVFDTAFFADQEEASFIYPLPYAWYADWGIRRFGFHGISHHYCTQRAKEILPDQERLVICHLGNGCSASAVRAGKAVTSTMGFTPLEGLMMGTRSGSIDPGIMLHLLKHGRLTVDEMDRALNKESGLLGVSGVASDFRQVQAAADEGNERARLALQIFADRVRAAIGALAVTLGRVDALVFTAGIGEHAVRLREQVCGGLECLGLVLDAERNENCRADSDIARVESPGRILVMHTREELLIAREVLSFL